MLPPLTLTSIDTKIHQHFGYRQDKRIFIVSKFEMKQISSNISSERYAYNFIGHFVHDNM